MAKLSDAEIGKEAELKNLFPKDPCIIPLSSGSIS